MSVVLAILSIFMFVAVFLPLVRNDYWIFKVLEYPRLQKLAIVCLLIFGWVILPPGGSTLEWVSFSLLCLSTAYLIYKILPYTRLSPREMKSITPTDSREELVIFAANVYQPNNEYDRLLSQIHQTNPDLIFLLETDEHWEKAVAQLEETHPYTLKHPLDNTYGLLFFSRLKLEQGAVRFLVKDDIPSIEAVVRLPSGRSIHLWGLHPEPPVPGENLYSTAKDKELMKVALAARECIRPCIVIGDLNDVAWSHTTELFRKTSELLDPRRGRGFYSTFNAHSWFVRFPLDYIFCSKEFGLVSMKRLPANGSDHFATVTHLALHWQHQNNENLPEADKEELEEAKEKAKKPVQE